MQLPQFYIEGLKSLPAIITAASVNRLSLAALLLLLTAGLIFYLMRPAPVIWRFLSIVLLVITGLAVGGQNVGGLLLPQLVQVFEGTEPNVGANVRQNVRPNGRATLCLTTSHRERICGGSSATRSEGGVNGTTGLVQRFDDDRISRDAGRG